MELYLPDSFLFNFGHSIKDWLKHFMVESILHHSKWNNFKVFFFTHKGAIRRVTQSHIISSFLCRSSRGTEFKGIKIKGEENKLSKFADYTTMFLNGSQES